MSTTSLSTQFSQLKERYNLQELGLSQQVSDRHIQKFSSSHGSKWKLMPTYLGLATILAEDFDCASKSKEENRHNFFSTWKQVKGSSATYKALITALLEINCREDAESVCRLVPQGPLNPIIDADIQDLATPTDPAQPIPLNLPPALDLAVQLDSGASAVHDIPTKLDPTVKKNLKHILHQNWKKIQDQYASYMSCLCQRVKQTKVSVEDFCFYLINLSAFKSKGMSGKLLAHAKNKLEKADTINKIFRILSDEECTSFLNCEIFLSIQRNYHISSNDCEELNYYEHLQEYVHKHKISEFVEINPKLQEYTDDSEKIIVKFDISIASKLDELLDLQDSISAILGVLPGALRLFSVEEGCVVVTFLVPTQLAQIIFTSEKEFTAEEMQEFQDLPVLWLECNHCKFEFETGRKGKYLHIIYYATHPGMLVTYCTSKF